MAKNTLPHQKCSNNHPPMIGPNATAMVAGNTDHIRAGPARRGGDAATETTAGAGDQRCCS